MSFVSQSIASTLIVAVLSLLHFSLNASANKQADILQKFEPYEYDRAGFNWLCTLETLIYNYRQEHLGSPESVELADYYYAAQDENYRIGAKIGDLGGCPDKLYELAPPPHPNEAQAKEIYLQRWATELGADVLCNKAKDVYGSSSTKVHEALRDLLCGRYRRASAERRHAWGIKTEVDPKETDLAKAARAKAEADFDSFSKLSLAQIEHEQTEDARDKSFTDESIQAHVELIVEVIKIDAQDIFKQL